jgi:hypothetical protein
MFHQSRLHHPVFTARARWSLVPLLLGNFLLFGCGSESDDKHIDPALATPCQLTCRDLKNCRLQCDVGDAACAAACNVLATTEAKTAYDAATACAKEHACTDDACLEQHCAAAVAACLPPIAPSDAPNACLITCGTLLGCRQQCNGATACQQACDAKAISLAKTTYDAAMACLTAHGCKDAEGDCAETNCKPQLDKCQ